MATPAPINLPNEWRTAGLEDFSWDGGDPLPGAAGRGNVHVVQSAQGRAVVRHYRRGGALARVFGDRYWFSGAAATRCFREFQVLHRLFELGLPVGRPLAARFQRSGPWYRADLATALIPDARSLHQVLAETGLRADIAAATGRLIARFHAAGLWHADLNAHNILADTQGRLWLIDMDRSRFRPVAGHWRQRNLDRLARSLHKLGHLGAASPSSEAFQSALKGAYERQFAVLVAPSA